MADILDQIFNESTEDRLVRAFLGMVDCSAVVDAPRYVENIPRPVDRDTMLNSYTKNYKLSTCQLAQEAGWRRSGVPDSEITGHEPFDGGISARQMRLCKRYDAWKDIGSGLDAKTFAGLLTKGRGWWIDNGSGQDVHAGSCITNAVVIDANTVQVDTVEGGQFKVNDADHNEHPIGSTAQRKFTRTWHLVNSKWMLGARHCIAIQCAELLPIPTTFSEVVGQPDPSVTVPTGRAIRGEDTSGDE